MQALLPSYIWRRSHAMVLGSTVRKPCILEPVQHDCSNPQWNTSLLHAESSFTLFLHIINHACLHRYSCLFLFIHVISREFYSGLTHWEHTIVSKTAVIPYIHHNYSLIHCLRHTQFHTYSSFSTSSVSGSIVSRELYWGLMHGERTSP